MAVHAVVDNADLPLLRCCWRSRALHGSTEDFALLLRDLQLQRRWLPAAVRAGQGAGTPRRSAVDLAEIELALTACLVPQGNIAHTVVDKLGDGCEVRGLLSPLLRAGTHEGGSQLSCQGPILPEAPSSVKEGLHLRSHHAEARGHAEHEAIILRQLGEERTLQQHHIRRLLWGPHSLKSRGRQGLWNLKKVHTDTRGLQSLLDLVCHDLHVAIGGVVDDCHARARRLLHGGKALLNGHLCTHHRGLRAGVSHADNGREKWEERR
mmetsp:Transcript_110374/g.263033  ORF Transcript_110374/g.263033 Transcript_110374/m.263033 type:complete len:265 (+) Transcript_110374:951-1745(+)